MIECSSSARSGGMIRSMLLPIASSARVAEHALGLAIPRLDDAVERLADDDVLRGLDDGRQPRLRLEGLHAVVDVTEHQHRADDALPRRHGLARRCRRLAARRHRGRRATVWFASPTTRPSRRARSAGFSTALAVGG